MKLDPITVKLVALTVVGKRTAKKIYDKRNPRFVSVQIKDSLRKEAKPLPDDHREVVPLLPIPNRTVKHLIADDSWLYFQ